MPLESGTRLGPYEITAQIGSGGMGEVYRASDTKLGRDVAIKVLPEDLAADDERLARFEREARSLAALNHPNVATLFGFEQEGALSYLVMELVEGEDLAARIARGPIPANDAISLFIQIADGLEAAHDRGIIHRDLKPANITLSTDGRVKILDFGLAKAREPGPADSDPSESPTLTAAAFDRTEHGRILGTAAYMSPEQAKGKSVDRKADIWAFGVCLYEALAGRQAFRSDDVADTLAAVLRADLSWSDLPEETPRSVRRLLRRCLRRELRDRLHDIGDARIELQDALAAGDEDGQPTETTPTRLGWRGWALAFAAGVAASIGVWLSWPDQPTSGGSITRTLVLPTRSISTGSTETIDLALSADGNRIVYRGSFENEPRLLVRALDVLEPTPLLGLPDDAGDPFLSPDGEWVGFFTGGRLSRVPIDGGPPEEIAGGIRYWSRGASWGGDGRIVFATEQPSGLWRVTATGGEPEELTTPKLDGENHLWPEILPDGSGVLFTKVVAGEPIENSQLTMVSLADGRQTLLLSGAGRARHVEPGHLVFARGGSLWAVTFDLDRAQVGGEPVEVVPGVVTKLHGGANFSAAHDGSLLYEAGGFENLITPLAWIDRQGHEELLPLPPANYGWPRVSPDGSRVVLMIRGGNVDVWSFEVGREASLFRVTTNPALDNLPIWTADGESIVFPSNREADTAFFEVRQDGTGPLRKLLVSEQPGMFRPFAWSPDGRYLVFDYGESDWQIGLFDRVADSWQPLIATAAQEIEPMLSPDGEWIAYVSDRTGRREVYVERFPELGDRLKISTAGGDHPVWSRDGDELFYLEEERRMMAVAVQTQPSLAAAPPELLFEGEFFFTFDIHPDGRFIMAKRQRTSSAPRELVLVQNWTEELQRLVP